MAQIDLSLIICTRNRAHSLMRCLDAVTSRVLDSDGFELVVVDNGSTDATPQVIADCVGHAPFFVRPVSEPVAGLSRARNAGLRAARGRILAFTDDDCYVGADYGKALVEAFDRGDIDYCGGRILLFDREDAEYVCRSSETPERFDPHRFIPAGRIQGANMAFTRDLVERVGPFDEQLGAGTPFRCEDADYVARASRAGFVGAYVPELVVYHHHGRRPGEDIDSLSRDNDFARGAYYIKQLLHGDLSVLLHWPERTYRSRSWPVPHRASVELRGAMKYLVARQRTENS